jgi:hypothetical protein
MFLYKWFQHPVQLPCARPGMPAAYLLHLLQYQFGFYKQLFCYMTFLIKSLSAAAKQPANPFHH